MTQFIQAVFEHGIFRPLEPVQLAEHERVSLVVAPASVADEILTKEADSCRERALGAALDAAANLPSEGPDDGFSGANHDEVLYGWKK